MASRIATPCKARGCPNVLPCALHPVEDKHRDYNERRRMVAPRFAAFYRSGEWKRLSLDYRARHPFCECGQHGERTVLGELVDHRVELEDGGAPLDPSNLQTLTFACHARKTAAARRARGEGGSMSGRKGQSSGRPTFRASSGNPEGGGFDSSGGSA